MEDQVLNPEVAEKYDLVGVPVGTHQFNGFGTIDLSEVDLERADALYARKFPHFIPKENVESSVAEKE